MADDVKLQEKWWWRLLKVIYILAWISVIGILFLQFNTDRPKTVKSNNKINILCNNNDVYNVYPSESFYGDISLVKLTTKEDTDYRYMCKYGLGELNKMNRMGDDKVTNPDGLRFAYEKAIESGYTRQEIKDYIIGTLKHNEKDAEAFISIEESVLKQKEDAKNLQKNYTIANNYETEGSWTVALKNTAIWFTISFVSIEATKSIFLYIVGIGVLRGMLLYFVLLFAVILNSFNNEGENK